MADFEALLAEAHRLKLRLLLDFVPNHSSDHHSWFLESRSSVDNPKRDWYIWADTPTPPNNWLSVFGGSTWEHDPVTNQSYYHAFLKEQPDLNYRNPDVVEAMKGVLGYWLERGVDGFRVDAIPFLFESTDLSLNEPTQLWNSFGAHNYTQNVPPIHSLCAQLMAKVLSYGHDKFFLGEVYAPINEIVAYYGTREAPEFSMPFNFFLLMDANAYVPSNIAAAIETYTAAVPAWGWTNYVMSNHDNPRIATKVGAARASLANLLLLTLRGTPTLYYGQELGMQDVPIPPNEIKDPWAIRMGQAFGRDPERTPMQWTCAPNAGYCASCTPWLPVAADFCSGGMNVEAQLEVNSSALRVLTATIAERRRSRSLLEGAQSIFVASDETGVLAFKRSAPGSATAVVAMNWGTTPVMANLSKGFRGTGYAAVSTVSGAFAPRHAFDMGATPLAVGEGLLLFSSLAS